MQFNSREEDATIWVFLRVDSGIQIPRVLRLWSPPLNWDLNLVSMSVVVDILGLEIQDCDSDDPDVDFNGRSIATKGYVDLDWGFKRSRSTFRTRFLVVQQGNSEFDLVLGRKSAIQYGLVDSGSPTVSLQPARMVSGYQRRRSRLQVPGRA